MPLTDEEYEKEMMFPVFDGMIPEGWLLDIASDSWKIDRRDRGSQNDLKVVRVRE